MNQLDITVNILRSLQVDVYMDVKRQLMNAGSCQDSAQCRALVVSHDVFIHAISEVERILAEDAIDEFDAKLCEDLLIELSGYVSDAYVKETK